MFHMWKVTKDCYGRLFLRLQLVDLLFLSMPRDKSSFHNQIIINNSNLPWKSLFPTHNHLCTPAKLYHCSFHMGLSCLKSCTPCSALKAFYRLLPPTYSIPSPTALDKTSTLPARNKGSPLSTIQICPAVSLLFPSILKFINVQYIEMLGIMPLFPTTLRRVNVERKG